MIKNYAVSSIRILSPVQTRSTVLANLGLPDNFFESTSSPSRIKTLAPEVIRATLWALSIEPGPEEMHPVYISKVLNSVKRQIEWINQTHSPNDMDDEDDEDTITQLLRQAVDELETIGDIASLPGGYWLPAPLRCIDLRESKRWLLVGGAPTRYLPESVRESLEFSGTARLLARDPSTIGLLIPNQTKEVWCRLPTTPVDVWAKEFLEKAKLKPFFANELNYKFYVPGIPKSRSAYNKPQYNRWIDMADIRLLPDQRYLMRHESSFGMVNFSIAEIQGHKLGATGSIELAEGGIRRLQYGIDALAGLPVSVRVERLNREIISYTLKSELPSPENRLLYAIGSLRENKTENYYPRIWEIKRSYKAEVDAILGRLGIRLE